MNGVIGCSVISIPAYRAGDCSPRIRLVSGSSDISIKWKGKTNALVGSTSMWKGNLENLGTLEFPIKILKLRSFK